MSGQKGFQFRCAVVLPFRLEVLASVPQQHPQAADLGTFVGAEFRGRLAAKFGKDQLKAFVERIERLEEEKKTIAADIKEVYAEAKGNGFDIKILRKVISLRKKEASERQEEEALIDVYLAALGMAPSVAENFLLCAGARLRASVRVHARRTDPLLRPPRARAEDRAHLRREVAAVCL